MSSVVQAASGSSTSTALTLTFPAKVTWPNSVVIALAGYVDGAVSKITLGDAAAAFTNEGPVNRQAAASAVKSTPTLSLTPGSTAADMQCVVRCASTGRFFVTQPHTEPDGVTQSTRVTRTDAQGVMIDQMVLNGAGHGSSIGIEYSGGVEYVWITWSQPSLTNANIDNNIVRFPWPANVGTAGTRFDRSAVAGLTTKIPGPTYRNVQFDWLNNLAVVRTSGGTSDSYAQHPLANVLAGNISAPLYTINLTQSSNFGVDGYQTSQGFCTYKGSLFRYTGAPSDIANGDPTVLTEYRWADGSVVRALNLNSLDTVNGAPVNGKREPEAVTLYDVDGTSPMLYFAVVTGPAGAHGYDLFTLPLMSGNCEIWGNLSVSTVDVTTVRVTTTVAGIVGNAYEVRGAVNTTGRAALTLDKAAAQTGTGTAWNSGSTAATFNAQQEFVIGIGGVFNNAGTVTAPTAGGWTNSAPMTNVMGTTPIGAVSGYKFTTGSNVVNYAGSAGSGSWAACAATFICAGIETGWGGLIFDEHPSYTGVSASWVVPALTTAGETSIWVGLGNVYQTGIFLQYDSTAPGGGSAGGWTWMLPGAGELWDKASYPVVVGDSMRATMSLSTSGFDFTLANSTKGWSYTERKSVEAVHAGSEGWIWPMTRAEVIMEKEFDNPNYGSVTFTNITTTPAISATPSPVVTVNTAVDQYPGPFSNGSFTMFWTAPK